MALGTITPLREKIESKVQDRQQSQVPDRVRLRGWLGARTEANDINRLARIDVDRLLEGYRKRPGRQTWDGEHVGKWLHAATLSWVATGNPDLRAKMDLVALELPKCQLSDGYLGTYADSQRWTEWDVWAHKYNLIGLITYMRHTGNMQPMETCRKMADLLCATFGEAAGQRDILSSGRHLGMASTSILEPMVWLYRLTGEPRYLDFCRYIFASWEKPHGPKIISTLLAGKGVDMVGNGKAYEMLSCINGALEFYRITGEERILTAALHAWEDIVAKRLYITGTASYQEFFRTDFDLPNVNKVGETCVTVTWLQFNAHLLRLTGEARFAEQLERVVLNQLLGAQSPDGTGWGYYVEMEGKKPYTSVLDGHCCLSSGPRGLALVPTFATSVDQDGIVVNLYNTGSADLVLQDQTPVQVQTQTGYPFEKLIRVEVTPVTAREFSVKLRIPQWCREFGVKVNGKQVSGTTGADGYLALKRQWRAGDQIDLTLQMEPRVVVGDFKNEGKAALCFGPLVLAVDEALLNKNSDFKLSAVRLPSTDVKALQLSQHKAGAETRAWTGSHHFRTELALAGANGQLKRTEIDLVPFAEAGAKGSSYKVWLRHSDPRPDRNVLLDGIEKRSRRPYVRFREEGQPLAIRYAGCVNDNFQSMALTFDNRRAGADWYAVELQEPVEISQVVFYQGQIAQDGGWFDTSAGKPRIEAKTSLESDWELLTVLEGYPATTATDPGRLRAGERFSCELEKPVSITALRVFGKPSCGDKPDQNWSTCLELQAFGQRRLSY
jgi:DUF1680 family protein